MTIAAIVTTVMKGTVTEINGIKVLNLQGSWFEMGRQYGELARKEINHVYSFMLGKAGGNAAIDDKICRTAELLFCNYPEYLRDFMNGEAETSGLTAEQLRIVNAVEYAEADFACSGFAVCGKRSATGYSIYGRNYDCISYASIADDVIITVFHPDDGSLSTANIGYAGELYAVNCINEKGLFVELNNGMPSAGYGLHYEMCQSTVELFTMMQKAQSMADLESFFQTTRSSASYIIGVASRQEVRCYEWCHDGIRRSDTYMPEGVMLLTNHYVHPDWPYPTPTDSESWNSITRRANMLSQAKSHENIDAEMLSQLIDTPLASGGPRHEYTKYQLVVDIATMSILIQIVGRVSWTRIDLNQFLGSMR